ncbi:MAG: hypothetical protein P9M06_00050 [Candidatus Saelkia tenebricola]|nr:hypothetical protein [Candidatus Saelkia tenebricola]
MQYRFPKSFLVLILLVYFISFSSIAAARRTRDNNYSEFTLPQTSGHRGQIPPTVTVVAAAGEFGDYSAYINGTIYLVGEGFEGFLVEKIDEEYGGIYSPDGILTYKFRFVNNPTTSNVDIHAENLITPL